MQNGPGATDVKAFSLFAIQRNSLADSHVILLMPHEISTERLTTTRSAPSFRVLSLDLGLLHNQL
jgi:hypothetical protein